MSTGPYDTSVTEALNALRAQLGAGVMFDKALRTSSRACGGERRRAFEAASERATASSDIADIASEFIPVLTFAERAMFITAWNGGRIDPALAAMIDRRRLMAEIGRKIRSGMIQPVFVLFIGSFVSPLPAFLVGHPPLTMTQYLVRAITPLALLLFAWLMGNRLVRLRARELAARGMNEPPAPISVMDRLMIYTPFVSHTERMKNLAEFCALLSSLTLAGVQTREAFAMLARAMPNGMYRKDIDRIREETVKGNTIAASMKPGILWPEDFINIVDVAETTGDLDAAMERQAQLYLERYTESVRRWGVVFARLGYVMVCLFLVYNIYILGSQYANVINDAANGKFPGD